MNVGQLVPKFQGPTIHMSEKLLFVTCAGSELNVVSEINTLQNRSCGSHHGCTGRWSEFEKGMMCGHNGDYPSSTRPGGT